MSKETITPYDAKWKRQFMGTNHITGESQLVTARENLANLVDGQWKYSWHWPNNHSSWVLKVQEDIDSELKRARKRLEELKEAQSILDRII